MIRQHIKWRIKASNWNICEADCLRGFCPENKVLYFEESRMLSRSVWLQVKLLIYNLWKKCMQWETKCLYGYCIVSLYLYNLWKGSTVVCMKYLYFASLFSFMINLGSVTHFELHWSLQFKDRPKCPNQPGPWMWPGT